MPGCSENTEIAVEMALNSTQEDFIKELINYKATKVSFRLQTLNPQVREYMNLPNYKGSLDRVLKMINGNIPIINADLINGLPGQTIESANSDLQAIIDHPSINSISSYLLTAGAAPALIAKVLQNKIPQHASMDNQILMRLNTFRTLKSAGWVRKGTETYMDPSKISEENLAKISGNECIGAFNHDSYLLGIGPQAISYLPGLRLENYVDVNSWIQSAERGEHAFFLEKCSNIHQRDLALWTFPLSYKGLSYKMFDTMINSNVLDESQLTTFNELLNDKFIIKTSRGYELSLLGEVFKGQLVLDLKKKNIKKL